MLRRQAVRAGWSRTRVPIAPGMRVLDVGSGAFPNQRADVLCDAELTDNLHRAGLPAVIDRPFVLADVTALPFRDRSFDFVIVSHLAEHVREPLLMCAELARVAVGGYLETPSPMADWLLDEEYHIWRVGHRRGLVEFRHKRPHRGATALLTDRFYRLFYAAQPSCARPVYRLPPGPVGRLAAFLLKSVGAALNRAGVMHTRVIFGPDRALRARITGSDRRTKSSTAVSRSADGVASAPERFSSPGVRGR